MRGRRWIAALILLGVLIAVRAAVQRDHHGASASAGSHGAALTVHVVSPALADRGATGPGTPSLAVAGARSNANGLLLVFLPGAGARPSCCTLFLSQAASLGYLAISLAYESQTTVGTRDDILDRLAAVLRYLAGRYPDEGWTHLLRDGQPRWSSIVMSGHSQGGSEAVFIATAIRLRGAIALSAPADPYLSHRPAAWLASVPHGPTPLRRIVGFVHERDPLYGRIVADWGAMRLPSLGHLSTVDGASSPYGGTHELASSARLPSVVLAPHDSTAVDTATPRCADGSAQYAPVWDYMLEVAGGQRVVRGVTACS